MPRKPKCNDDEVIKVTCVKRKKSSKRKCKKRSPCDKKIRSRPKSPGRRKKSKSQRSRARNKTAAAAVGDPNEKILKKINTIARVLAANRPIAIGMMDTADQKLQEIKSLLEGTPEEELADMITATMSKPQNLENLKMLENFTNVIEKNPNGLMDVAQGLLGGGGISKLITNSAESGTEMPGTAVPLLNY